MQLQLTRTPFEGLCIIHFPHFSDKRGEFQKIFNYEELAAIQEETRIDIKEIYYSVNKKDVIRGMHFQTPPYEHWKNVSVIKGSIFDVVVDLRTNQSTYGQHFIIELDSAGGNSLLIPPGFAHGFAALEDDSIVNYAQTSVYAPDYDRGIRYDSCGILWPKMVNPIVSARDMAFPILSEFKSPF